ncbi:MAG: tripartite tricarboxylate transporter substrate binding protein [Burkholderiales bacterium]|nr:tripartite tricarboxylate transporter substrate binding protein [Burkholderiales bacterium]
MVGRGILVAWAAACLLQCGMALAADAYPAKPVRIVVPFAAGGSTDILARNIAQRLNEVLRGPVIVENRPGGGAVVGAEYVAKSAPDGYTLLMGTNTTHAVAPHLYSKLPYNALRDFIAIGEVANNPQFLDVHPSIPVRSVKELIALARARPGQLNYGSAGQGSASHMAMELFKSMAKIDLVHVPYKGTGPAMIDLLGGHLSLMFDVVLTTLPYMKAGKVRVLGVSSLTRAEVAPEVPTIAETGLPGYEALVWFGLFAPAGTPTELVARLSSEIGNIVRQPKLRETMVLQGLTPVGSSPSEFAARVSKDNAVWGKVIREAGIKLD